jgi:hypothetical protein
MEEQPDDPTPEATRRPYRWSLVAIICALAGASIAYRVIYGGGLEQSAALFIGVPTILALIVTMMPTSRSAVGLAMQSVTLFLAVVGIFLWEGLICILVAAPLFYLVALIIGLLVDRNRKSSQSDLMTYAFIALPLLIMSLEGVHDSLSFGRAQTVSVEQIVDASPAEVEAELARVPRFDRELPFYLRLGFPRPIAAEGSGLETGSRRRITFEGGSPETPAYLDFEVSARRRSEVVFKAIADRTHIGRWLRWKAATVSWTEHSPGKTLVRWQLEYDRLLDPSWYFSQWEQYGTVLAAEYLIATLATPER